jgi:hypothetical protein
VTAIPIYVVPRDVDGTVPGSEPLSYTQGTYWQDVTFQLGCLNTEVPDWSNLSWTAAVPAGTSVEFALCTASTAEGLKTCTVIPVAKVVGSGSCMMDSQCGLGFCAPGGVCQTITSGTCVNDSHCALGSTCNGETCVYRKQPVYVGTVLGQSNLNTFLRMQLTLNANVVNNDSPVVYDWALTYVCRLAL